MLEYIIGSFYGSVICGILYSIYNDLKNQINK